jgi:hypothetical protein
VSSRKAKTKDLSTVGTLVPGQWEIPGQKGIGTLHGPKTLFIRSGAGTATTEDDEYELACGGFGGPGPPIIRSKKTGQWFQLRWEDILDIAIAAGISIDQKQMKGK